MYAVSDRSDRWHERCSELIATTEGPLYLPALTLAEAGYLLEKRHGASAEARFLASIATGELILEHPTQPDLLRMAELVVEYADFPLGTVDASVVAVAERLGVTTIATLDRRHFGAVRPRHVERFELLP